MLDNLERNLDEALGGLYYSFSTALCSADEIYAELAAMVDDDALAYLQKEYGTIRLNQLKLFQDVAEKIETVKGSFDRKLELCEVQFIQKGILHEVPEKLIEHFVRSHYGELAGKVGDFTNLKGSTLDEILSRIPYDAKYKRFNPKPGCAQEGFKFQWERDGKTYRLEVHDVDPSAPVGSHAASGWVVRVRKGRCYYDYTTNEFRAAKFTKKGGPDYDAVIANDTHIPIKNPYGEK